MKRTAFIILCILCFASTVSGQTFPYYPPNDLEPTVPIALFTNSPYESVVSTLQARWYENSGGVSQLQVDVFPLSITPSISGDEKVAYEEMRPLIEGHPGYYVYIFTAPICSCGCSFGYAMDPLYQATAFLANFTSFVIGHELVHALGSDHYHRVICSEPFIDPSCSFQDEGGGDISLTAELPLSLKEMFGWVTVPEITTSQPFADGKIPYRAAEYLYVYQRTDGIHIDYVKALHRWTMEWDWNQTYKYAVFSSGQKCINMDIGSVSISSQEITFSAGECSIPDCVPLPTQTRIVACPKPYKGMRTQERVSTCPGPAWSPWVTINDTCTKKGKGN